MPHAASTRNVLGAAIATVLLFATGADAFAQAARKAEERRSRDTGREETAKPTPRFTESTRKEPGLRASPRLNDELNTLFKHYEGEDVAGARVIADKIIADPKANAYERALAARIAGSMLIGTDDARAQAYLQQAVDANGLSNNEHFESMLVVAQLQMQNEQFREAVTTLDAFLAGSASTDPEHQVLKANALYQMEQYPEAIAILRPVVEGSTEPKPEWSQLLMAAYSEAGQPAEASQLAERIAASTPSDKRAQLNLAATYIQTGQDDKALAVYEQLRTTGQLSEDREYRNMYALYLGGDGKEQQAIEVINEGLEKGILKPDHQAYVALAQAYYFSEQPAKAIEAYQKAAPLAPDGETHLNLAKVLANEGRAEESRAAAQQALDKGVKKPDDAQRLLSR
jgi:tetratricopeptide (TPR) repeat protein